MYMSEYIIHYVQRIIYIMYMSGKEDLSPWVEREEEQPLQEEKRKIGSQSTMSRTHRPYQLSYYKQPEKSITRQSFHKPLIYPLQVTHSDVRFQSKFERMRLPTKTTIASKYFTKKQDCHPLFRSNSTPYFILKIQEFIRQNVIEKKKYQHCTKPVNNIRKSIQLEMQKKNNKCNSIRIKKRQHQHFLDRILTKLS